MENVIGNMDNWQTNGRQAGDKITIIKPDNDAPKSGLAGLMQTLEREDGYISLVRVMAAVAFVAYMAAYLYAVYKQITLPHFDTFSAFVGAVIFATLGSKYLDFKQQVHLGK